MNETIDDRVLERPLPNSAGAECAILGAIILDDSLVSQAIELLKPEDFYVPNHRRIFQAMASLFQHGSEIDPILIAEELRRDGAIESVGGLTFITNLTYGLPHITDIWCYAEIILEASLRRQLIKVCDKISSEAQEGEDAAVTIYNRAEQEICSLSDRFPELYPKKNDTELSTLPELNPMALHGLAGDFVRLIEPHTEADPAALLVQFLVAFGNCVGRGPHFIVEADNHYGSISAVIVGATGSGRKGTSLGHVNRCFEAVDGEWARNCIISGLSSGEGLIYAVRDPIEQHKPVKENGRPANQYEPVVVDHGVSDKRLLVQESEFAAVLRAQGREGNTLSAVLRQAWDNGSLRTLVKSSPARATGAHISILGHITGDELQRCLSGVERFNGYANRFLWVFSRRSKFLPDGGQAHKENYAEIIRRLSSAISVARGRGELRRDRNARALWHEVYPDLSSRPSGLFGALTARAAPHAVRLSLLYALLDRSESVRREHLEAALALWKYSEDSVRYVFKEGTGDRIAHEILRALRTAGAEGLTRTEINDLFRGHRKSDEIRSALNSLLESGLAKSTQNATAGRPVERWHAVTHTAGKEEKAEKDFPKETYSAFSAYSAEYEKRQDTESGEV